MSSRSASFQTAAYETDRPRVVVGEVPPAFADLNKSVKDLFTKNYNIGLGKIDLHTTLPNGLETRGIIQQDIGGNAPRSFGSVESKYVCRDYGLTVVEKWNTDNLVTMEASVEDKFLAGAKVTFLAGLSVHTGKRNAGLKFVYKRPFLHATTDVDLDFAGPIFRSSAVSSYKNLRFGGNIVFDSAKSAITRHSLALGFGASNYTFHAGTSQFRDFDLGIHSKIHSKLEAGVQSNFSSAGGNALLAVGAKYDLDAVTSVKAKLDTVGQVGVSLTQEVSKGVKLNLSSLINGYNLASGEHRFGFGLEVDL